jgi:hypothetical protein
VSSDYLAKIDVGRLAFWLKVFIPRIEEVCEAYSGSDVTSFLYLVIKLLNLCLDKVLRIIDISSGVRRC